MRFNRLIGQQIHRTLKPSEVGALSSWEETEIHQVMSRKVLNQMFCMKTFASFEENLFCFHIICHISVPLLGLIIFFVQFRCFPAEVS